MTPARGAQFSEFFTPPFSGTPPDARHQDVGRRDVDLPSSTDQQEPALAVAADRLRVDHVEAQPVVQRELRRRPPRVLRVIEVPPLPLPRVGERADVAPEVRHVAEQERRQAEPAAVGPRVRSTLNVSSPERWLIARHAQVPRAPDVDAELHRVVALQHPREVADQLQLLLVLVERAVAAVDAEARSEIERRGCPSTNPPNRPDVNVLSRLSP